MADVHQDRFLDSNPGLWAGRVNKSAANPVPSAGPSVPAWSRSFQETFSFRTEAPPEEGSPQDYKSWTDTTRNGFRTFTSQFDRGHEFWTYKRTVSYPMRDDRFAYDDTSDYCHFGPKIIGKPDGLVPATQPLSRMSGSEITSQGQKMILAASPITSDVSLGAFLGELREGLPALIGLGSMKEGANLYRGLGGEYLNVQFGWKPFISDIQKLMKTVSSTTQRLTQLQRDSGRVVRRKLKTPEAAPEITFSEVKGYPTFLTALDGSTASTLFGFTNSKAPATRITRKSSTYSFAGAMTYYTDIGNGVLDNMVEFQRKADAFLGATLSPTVLWELAPWSWLIDWVSNIGDAIAVGDQIGNGLVLRYGYLMKETHQTDLLESPDLTFRPITGRRDAGVKYPSFSNLHEQVLKERVRASPFGFAVTVDNFSAAQWAILAALGMSSAPKVLSYSNWT